LVRRGWSVIPLNWRGTVEDRKRPLLDAWGPYQTTRASETQVTEWWSRWPQANIALLMGEVSGLVALDFDGPHAAHLAKVFLPRTAAVKTGKGFHAFYRHPGYRVHNGVRLKEDEDRCGIDVKADGGYVVAPPSVHGSGHVYRWLIHPDEGIADLPAGVAAMLSQHEQRKAENGRGAAWVEEALAGVPEGQRNETAAQLSGYWLRVTEGNREATWHAMRLWARFCTPPMPERELRATVESIARREAARRSHEEHKDLHRHEVVEGPRWAEELRDAEPRRGLHVEVPAFSVLGGLVPGDMIVLAGRPGMGKSTMACQLTVRACVEQAIPTLVVSSEMTRRDWGFWMAAIVGGCSTLQLPRPLPDALLNAFRASPVAVVDSGTITIHDIRLLAESRPGLKLLIVDHIGRIVGQRRDSRVLEVGEVARGLKSIAKDLRCTVVALCQLNRRVEGTEEKEPRLSDLRESGEIEQEADSVVFLWTKERDILLDQLPGFATVAKNRHGRLSRVATMFDKPARVIRPAVRVP